MKPTDEEIQALLRSARVEEPMPTEVASRLDDVLAGLASEPAPVAPVLPLRRRMGPKLLAAAAAFVLVAGVGVGLQQVLSGAGDVAQSSKASDAGGAADAESAPEAPSAQSQDPTDGRFTDVDQLADRLLERSRLDTDLRTAARELAGVDEARDRVQDSSGPAVPSPTAGNPPSSYAAKSDDSCPEPALTAQAGALSEVVLLDGAPALLVVGPAVDERHVVELWSCGTEDALVTRENLNLG